MIFKSSLSLVVVISFFGVVTPARAQSSSDAPAADPATVELKADTSKPDKRLFGVLPNYRTTDASLPFSPLSKRQKLSIATHDLFDWPTYATAGFMTAVTPEAIRRNTEQAWNPLPTGTRGGRRIRSSGTCLPKAFYQLRCTRIHGFSGQEPEAFPRVFSARSARSLCQERFGPSHIQHVGISR